MAAPFTDVEIETIRAATPGCGGDLVHLNHAGSSLPSRTVLDTQIEYLEREAHIGGYEAAAEAEERTADVYRSVATLIGAEADQIARMEHATAAWNAAFWALPMRPGQRVLTHDHDYGANVVALLHAARTRGVVVEKIPSDDTGQIDLTALGAALDGPGEVAAVSLAWIPTNGGLVNPAAAVGALTREAGVPFLLDACQAVGQLTIDVDTIGCDALSATGRKFLRGPRGTGFLYVRPSLMETMVPSQPDHHGAEWTAVDDYEFVAGATRFEQWEFDHASWLGLGAAVDVALDLGVDRIQTTVARRAARLRSELAGIGLTVHDEGIARCGIVTVSSDVVDSSELQRRLHDERINASVTFAGSSRADVERRDLPPMLRLSVHCTTTDAEVDRCVEVLRRV